MSAFVLSPYCSGPVFMLPVRLMAIAAYWTCPRSRKCTAVTLWNNCVLRSALTCHLSHVSATCVCHMWRSSWLWVQSVRFKVWDARSPERSCPCYYGCHCKPPPSVSFPLVPEARWHGGSAPDTPCALLHRSWWLRARRARWWRPQRRTRTRCCALTCTSKALAPSRA